jgi:hypothetical protein
MKALHLFTGILLMLVVMAAGAGLAVVALRGGTSWSNGLALVEEYRLVVAAVGVAGVLIGAIWALSMLPRGRGGRYLAFENPGGEVRVSLDAVRDFLAGMGAEFEGMVKFAPEVRSVGGELDITAVCEVGAGCALPVWSQEVQERVRERIVSGIGIASIRAVRVVVRQIVDGGRKGRGTRVTPEPPAEAAAEAPGADDSAPGTTA